MGKMIKVQLELHQDRDGWAKIFFDHNFSLKMHERGVEWGSRTGDILFADTSPNVVIDRPAILYDMVDQACMSDKARSMANEPQVKLVLKPVSYLHPGPHNEDAHEGTRIGKEVRGTGFPREPISSETFNKTRVLTTLCMTHCMSQPWRKQVLYFDKMHKDIDVFFMGCTKYPIVNYPSYHRRKMCREIMSLPKSLNVVCLSTGMTGIYPIQPEEYWSLIKRAKMVVSPFGVGEYTFRDHEALMAQAVLIKPWCPPMTVTFDPYRYAIRCSANGERLEDAVEKYSQQRYDAAEYGASLAPDLWNVDKLADLMAQYVNEAAR